MPTEKINLNKIVPTYSNPPQNLIKKIQETLKEDNSIDFIAPIFCNKEEEKYYINNGNKRFYAVKGLAQELNFNHIWVDY